MIPIFSEVMGRLVPTANAHVWKLTDTTTTVSSSMGLFIVPSLGRKKQVVTVTLSSATILMVTFVTSARTAIESSTYIPISPIVIHFSSLSHFDLSCVIRLRSSFHHERWHRHRLYTTRCEVCCLETPTPTKCTSDQSMSNRLVMFCIQSHMRSIFIHVLFLVIRSYVIVDVRPCLVITWSVCRVVVQMHPIFFLSCYICSIKLFLKPDLVDLCLRVSEHRDALRFWCIARNIVSPFTCCSDNTIL